MFCKHCGENIGENIQNCPKCGESTQTQQYDKTRETIQRRKLSPAEKISSIYLISTATLTFLTFIFFIVGLAVNKWANIDYLFFIILFGAGYFFKKQSPEKHQKYYNWLFISMLTILTIMYLVSIIIRAV